MIPLAQAWLSNEHVTRTRYDAELRRHLELPTTYNKHSTPHALNTFAERIVFTNDIPSLMYEMEDAKQLTFSGILRTTRLPYDCFWLEYKARTEEASWDEEEREVYFGALVRKMSNEKVRMIIVCGFESHKLKGKLACGITYVIDFTRWPPMFELEDKKRAFGFNLIYAFNKDKIVEDDDTLNRDAAINISWILTEMIFGIFLITQPKVYKDEVCKASSKLQRSRAKNGKQPLLEYRRINVHIGRKYSHYTRPTATLQQALNRSIENESDAAIRHRKYHKVMGHFRHYVNTDNPHTTWIEPHYRGDPSLGVTFTERDVMR